MSFEYLTVGEQDEIADAFSDAGIVYDVTTRNLLLRGVNRQFATGLMPIVGADPYTQLMSDIMRLSQFERLNDGSIPLLQWLQNAAGRFNILPQRELFERLIGKVSKEGESTSESPVNTPKLQTDQIVPYSIRTDVKAAAGGVMETEEIITDEINDLQDISFLKTGASRTDSVGKIWVPRFQQGNQVFLTAGNPFWGLGTAWLIAGDLVMTNYHVIRNRKQHENQPSDADLALQAENSSVQFFYDAEGEAGVKVEVDELIAAGKKPIEDFALLRLAENPQIPILPIVNKTIDLPAPIQTPKGTITKVLSANIIQHPDGLAKRVALRNNLIYEATYPTLHYYADTLGGSSGSPVFDDAWRVMALHRAAVPKQTEFNGKILGYVNEGIQIHSILAKLEELAANDHKVAEALRQIKEEQNL